MKDLKLDEDHDLELAGFDLQLTDNTEIVKQRLKQALLTFKGEWFLNVDLGIPYYESILGEKNSLQAIRSIFISSIGKVEGVREITEFELKYNDDTRLVSIIFSVIDSFNNLIEIEI